MSEYEYVAAFAFDENGERVALVEKKRPKWQAGLLNGIGGKIEDIDQKNREVDLMTRVVPDGLLDSPSTAQFAMEREFREETGVSIEPSRWHHVCTLGDMRGWMVHFFREFLTNEEFAAIKTTEDEEIKKIPWYPLPQDKIIKNLLWLIPLCRDTQLKGNIIIEEITEDKPSHGGQDGN